MTYYTSGFPKFSIEKPVKYPYNPKYKETFARKQKSGKWYGELKLNEHRGFICFDEHGVPIFYSHTGNIVRIVGDALERLAKSEIPPSSVLDAGHLYRTSLGDTRLWIFDVLVLDGEKVDKPFDHRKFILDNTIRTDELVWRPLGTDFWLKEFEDMMVDNSSLIKRASMQYGVPYDKLKILIEGLVLKRKSGVLTYPSQITKVGNFLKMRLGDLKNSLRPDYIRPL